MITVCPVQVGSTVEVKTNEGLSSEAVISKLTDASLYTVGESLSADWSLPCCACDWLVFVHFVWKNLNRKLGGSCCRHTGIRTSSWL